MWEAVGDFHFLFMYLSVFRFSLKEHVLLSKSVHLFFKVTLKEVGIIPSFTDPFKILGYNLKE